MNDEWRNSIFLAANQRKELLCPELDSDTFIAILLEMERAILAVQSYVRNEAMFQQIEKMYYERYNLFFKLKARPLILFHFSGI